MEEPIKSETKKQGWTLERLLLVAVLALQVGIVAWLYNDHQEQTQAPALRLAKRPAPGPAVYKAQVQMPDPRRLLMNRFADPAIQVQHEMDRMMAQAVQTMEQMNQLMNLDDGWNQLMVSPTMDMRETADNFEVIYSLPDLKASDIDVQLDGRMLTVASGRHQATSGQHSMNRFESKVMLPGPTGNPREVKVDFTNGMLKVSVPRASADKTGLPKAI